MYTAGGRPPLLQREVVSSGQNQQKKSSLNNRKCFLKFDQGCACFNFCRPGGRGLRDTAAGHRGAISRSGFMFGGGGSQISREIRGAVTQPSHGWRSCTGSNGAPLWRHNLGNTRLKVDATKRPDIFRKRGQKKGGPIAQIDQIVLVIDPQLRWKTVRFHGSGTKREVTSFPPVRF